MSRSRFGYELILKFWKYGHVTDGWPLLGYKASEKTTSGHIIPVNQVVRSGENIVLPMLVLQPLIERASAVAVMNECMCRRGQKCRAFPHDLGCLLLGDAVGELNPSFGRTVTPAEAIAHSERAIRMGLVPLVIHDAIDAWIWGLDFRRMMNVCFCCDCCCDVRIGIRSRRTSGFYENIHRLPGLTLSVGEGCIRCGTCKELCVAGAVEIREDGAHIGENCKGCGRCVPACPQGAITMALDPRVDTIRLTLERYERRANIGPLSTKQDSKPSHT
ncbi:MAG: hypothetical protein C4532_01830 [Candidatus Abyssobacteria bacterium SURF_17]|uniref:4Fe-4S ferredoxin-type domain-containing protein n=1 Tax=Candidatus Abyssobacteria bacterium SURF_17 TaxID=2093361 RepID=A0A419F872_9BACT|nr:MAG: hypothetical protein C4532_01830 [Candidatus Abyssubacteria bacterium SURF_17]